MVGKNLLQEGLLALIGRLIPKKLEVMERHLALQFLKSHFDRSVSMANLHRTTL